MEILGALVLGTVAAGGANGIYSLLATTLSGRAPRLFLWTQGLSVLVLLLFLLEQILLTSTWLHGSNSMEAAFDAFPLLLRRVVFIGAPPAACNLAIFLLRGRKEVGWHKFAISSVVGAIAGFLVAMFMWIQLLIIVPTYD
jgi:hypothetical protein